MRIATCRRRTLSFGVHFLRALSLACLIAGLPACVAPFQDDSHYVAVTPTDGVYLLRKGSQLALQLGYLNPPVSANDDRMHTGSYVDVAAFRFDSAGLLAAPPAYFANFSPDPVALRHMAALRQGVSTWTQVQSVFGAPNWRIKQPDGGMVVYHSIAKES
jgi:hypothetical protein